MRFGHRFLLIASGALMTVAGLSAEGQGPSISITEFPMPPDVFSPWQITSGPDGNLWFTVQNVPAYIGRITPAGLITLFPIPTPSSQPTGIARGADGNLWFTETASNKIGRLSPFTQTFAEFPLPTPDSGPAGIAAGSDGNLWFCENTSNNIGRITPAGVITEFALPNGGHPEPIVRGSDGKLWFTYPGAGAQRIGSITTAGAINEIPFPANVANLISDLEGIASGPDGNLWSIGQAFSGQDQIVRVTPAGAFTMFPTLSLFIESEAISAGPDGNVWYAVNNGSKMARVTPAGVMTEFDIPTPRAEVGGITTGPDGNLWFTEIYPINQIARVNLAAASVPVPTLSLLTSILLGVMLVAAGLIAIRVQR